MIVTQAVPGSDLPPCLLLILFSSLLYANTLHSDFVHDDLAAIVNNADVTGGAGWTEVWRDDFWGAELRDPRSHKSYRPLTTLTFRWDHWVTCKVNTWE